MLLKFYNLIVVNHIQNNYMKTSVISFKDVCIALVIVV